jgi:hypothetical protein
MPVSSVIDMGSTSSCESSSPSFYTALCAELEPMLGANMVYLDQTRLSGGDLYANALANDLFESATMVVVYTPTYFHEDWGLTGCVPDHRNERNQASA